MVTALSQKQIKSSALQAVVELKVETALPSLDDEGLKINFAIIYTCVKIEIDFEGWIWVLIASVPGLCILFTFKK